MKIDKKNKWDELYKKGVYQGRYPTEDLIRFIEKKFPNRKTRKHIKILDWGMGTGRHVHYLAKEGFLTYGVEISNSGVKLTQAWLKKAGFEAKLHTIDGVNTPYPSCFFDAIIDCAAIQHNEINQIKKIISEIYRILKPDGCVFSFCKSKQDFLFRKGKKIEKDTYYIKDFTEAPTIIHFFDEKEIKSLWNNFKNVEVEYTERTTNHMMNKIAHLLVSIIK